VQDAVKNFQNGKITVVISAASATTIIAYSIHYLYQKGYISYPWLVILSDDSKACSFIFMKFVRAMAWDKKQHIIGGALNDVGSNMD